MYKIVAVLLLMVVMGCGNTQKSSDKVSYNYDVSPIITSKCLVCHGNDPSSREAGLRLDIREDALKILESGNKAIVPFKPEESEIINRIHSEDEKEIMPPPESKKTLSVAEKAIITKWIEQGAEYQKYWALEPYKYSEKNIDKLVSSRAETKGIDLDWEAADDLLLLRRLSYVLTGLPPSRDEIDKYGDFSKEEDYEKAVNYYLNSERFGERWARHWMDLVRYAETKGHEFDFRITGAWRYRDYLIRAFNNDIPYKQFVTEHIAGDLLETPRIDKKTGVNESQIATAYVGLGEGKHSPVDIKKEEIDIIDNIIDVTSKTFQSMTMACARCHDHKFDDIPTKDYYAFYGMIESSRFSPRPFRNEYKFKDAISRLDSLKEMQSEILASFEPKNPQIKSSDGKIIGDFTKGSFDNWMVDGEAFGATPIKIEAVLDTVTQSISYFEGGFASGKYYGKGIYGALRSPTFILETDSILVRARGFKSSIRIVIDNFQLIQNPIYGNLERRTNSHEFQDLIFNLSQWKGKKAYVEILNGEYNRHNYNLHKDAYIDVKFVKALTKNEKGRYNYKPQKSDNPAIRGVMLTGATKSSLASALVECNEISKNVKDSTFFIGMTDGDAINSHVFIRGNHNNLSEEKVKRGFLSVVPELKADRGSGRIELAKVLFDDKNFLTSRVIVNRIWHYMMGKGIVETVDNFGLQGKLPSNPELLDFLAIDLMENNWSMKSIIKEIAMSKTFRQTDFRSRNVIKQDPNNIYLTGFPMRRLEAEAIRDAILAVSGSINLKMYGESVPVYLTNFMNGRGRPSKSGPLDGDGRRSIYISVMRNFLSPFMLTFDRPQPFSTFGNRDETNVPAQSLTLMNDDFVTQEAEKWAKRLIDNGHSSIEERVNEIYLTAFTRMPEAKEVEKAEDFIIKQSKLMESEDILNNVAVWKDYCHAIFNFKEFIHIM